MTRLLAPVLLTLAVVTLSDPAAAYIGPGAGISLLGAFWGLLVAVFGAVGVIVWYPIRKMVRARRQPRPRAQPDELASPATRARH